MPPNNSMNAEIDRLAALPRMEYEVVRRSVAKQLGVRAASLDAAVDQKRNKTEPDQILAPVTPWDKPVDVAALLTDIAGTIKSFVSCPPEAANAAALWVALTWVIDAVHYCPLLALTSPERRCGKSTLLGVLSRLVRRPVITGKIRPPALFRAIREWQPTLLIDKYDAFMKDAELHDIINSGHTRDTACVIRAVGDNQAPAIFSTFGAKVLASIDQLPESLTDRAIVVQLRRKLISKKITRLQHADPALFHTLRRKLARFAADHKKSVMETSPDIPEALHDRARDNWEPLLAIADVAGGGWPETGSMAAVKLSGNERKDHTIGQRLLEDIQAIFAKTGQEKMFTAHLLDALCSEPERPWATYNRGQKLTPLQLAALVKGYEVSSKLIRIGSDVLRGYFRFDFEDAFSRYLTSADVTDVTST